MNQAPEKEQELKKEYLELPDHDLMEKIVGREVMKEVDKIVEDRSKDSEV